MIAELFWVPLATAPARAKARVSAPMATLGWLMLAGLVLLLRYPDWILRPRLWAEDGNVFFLDARELGLAALPRPYAGYVHLLPRLIACAGNLLDPGSVPAFYVASSLVCTLAVVALVLSPRLELPHKPLLALLVVLAPSTGEVFLCPTNLQWFTALALIVVPLARAPTCVASWALEAAVILVAGLTGPFSVIVAPLYLVHAGRSRAASGWIRFALILAPCLAQASSLMLHPAVPPAGAADSPWDATHSLAVVGARLFLAFLPFHWAPQSLGLAWMAGTGAAGIVALAALTLLVRRLRFERLCLAALVATLLAAACVRCRFDAWDFRDTVSGDRYFFLPRLLCAWWVCLGLSPTGAAGKWVARAVAALVAGLALGGSAPAPGVGPLAHEERPFIDWSGFVRDLREGREVRVAVSPGWSFVVPARRNGQSGTDLPQKRWPSQISLPSHVLWSSDAYFYLPIEGSADPGLFGMEALPRGLWLDRRTHALRGVAQAPGLIIVSARIRGSCGWISQSIELEFRRGAFIAQVGGPAFVPAAGRIEMPFEAFSAGADLDFVDVTDLTIGRFVGRVETPASQRLSWRGKVVLRLDEPGLHCLSFRFVCCDRGRSGAYSFSDVARQIRVVHNPGN